MTKKWNDGDVRVVRLFALFPVSILMYDKDGIYEKAHWETRWLELATVRQRYVTGLGGGFWQNDRFLD
jgi:hypothetical protein